MKKLILTAFCMVYWSAGGSAQVAVIAHKSVPMDKLEKSKLLDLYTGEIKSWPDDEPVVVLDLKPKSEVKKTFYKFLGKSSSRMKSIWLRSMLSGEGDPPESLQSEELLLKKVASTPGAIGFVSRPKVSDDVKILLVIKEEEE